NKSKHANLLSDICKQILRQRRKNAYRYRDLIQDIGDSAISGTAVPNREKNVIEISLAQLADKYA
ncbi:hypothetical protein, partial [Serratia marcescens]|uniref:hypothetical protein n=1 Tax=Serratia marcescens TaxID=615 RepID=UPI00237FE198